MEKINNLKIKSCNYDIFGEWINNDLKINKNTYDHIIIDNFIDPLYYDKIQKCLPNKPDENWWKYENPLEVKYALDDFELMDPLIQNIFYALSHDKIINKLRNIFNISNLEFDPFCHGGGLHMHPKYGRLNIHLDYEKHPITNKQRRLNIILYLNDMWNNDWNGDTQLFSTDLKECIVKSYPKSNTAIIFITNDNSWHGVPEIIKCPENIYRKTLAYYYVSDFDDNKICYRPKAKFAKLPNQPYDERMEKLNEIRSNRLITKEDLQKIWSDWNIYSI